MLTITFNRCISKCYFNNEYSSTLGRHTPEVTSLYHPFSAQHKPG